MNTKNVWGHRRTEMRVRRLSHVNVKSDFGYYFNVFEILTKLIANADGGVEAFCTIELRGKSSSGTKYSRTLLDLLIRFKAATTFVPFEPSSVRLCKTTKCSCGSRCIC